MNKKVEEIINRLDFDKIAEYAVNDEYSLIQKLTPNEREAYNMHMYSNRKDIEELVGLGKPMNTEGPCLVFSIDDNYNLCVDYDIERFGYALTSKIKCEAIKKLVDPEIVGVADVVFAKKTVAVIEKTESGRGHVKDIDDVISKLEELGVKANYPSFSCVNGRTVIADYRGISITSNDQEVIKLMDDVEQQVYPATTEEEKNLGFNYNKLLKKMIASGEIQSITLDDDTTAASNGITDADIIAEIRAKLPSSMKNCSNEELVQFIRNSL